MKLLAAIAAFLLAVAASGANWYVSCPASGTGTCLTVGNACTFATLNTKAVVGDDVVNVAGTGISGDGHYTGAACMLAPTFSGTSGHPITIQATNLNKVLIDGEGARTPINITGVSYLNITGFDACCSTTGTASTDVVKVHGAGVTKINLSYMIGWNAPLNGNAAIFNFYQSPSAQLDATLDTFAGFGTARKIAVSYQNTGPVVFSRGIEVWSRSQNVGPKMANSFTYNATNYTIRDVTAFWIGDVAQTYTLKNNYCEYIAYAGNCSPNPCTIPPGCLGTLETPYVVDQPAGMFAAELNAVSQANLNFYGLIGIVRNVDRFQPGSVVVLGNNGLTTIKDTVAVLDTAQSTKKGYNLYGCATCSTPKNMVATNLTSIGGTTNILSADWTATNAIVALTNNSTFKYDGSTGSSKANVCFLHDNSGNVTATARWPHPLAADLAIAMAYAGEVPIDEAVTVQAYLGTIPVACGGAAPTPTATFTATNTPTPTASPTPGGPTATPPPTPACSNWYLCGDGWLHIRVDCFASQTFYGCTTATPTP